ncbi:photoreceptor ankyrin repeat protein [Megalops cyprinoides]|uniref:photoreceptor ankyrin repeat protein n=1 Tax=Megalops cyprinoides TaxID=118141 RepID=UPI0018654782|nr:photoreceptor ankyrin repeat protein [Megalops cyprinoides]
MAHAEDDDPNLWEGPDEDNSELSPYRDDAECESVLSDDSVLPVYDREQKPGTGEVSTLYEAATQNDVTALRRLLERGVTQEEVMELDINGRNCLMLAADKGFVDIVTGLHHCPFIDINHQDKDGNTALMIAAQAGHINILNYILNYYSGVDTEVRDSRGFTALIKAAMQGRNDCVSSLIMAGADLNAVDTARGKCARDWALKTGRFETLQRLRRLNMRPCAEQFYESYVPEWPELKELVAKAMATKSRGERLTEHLRSSLTFSFPRDPQDNGVLDHMVRITTSIHSPLVATGCRPLCPTSPPEVGKRRLAVPELVQRHPSADLEEHPVRHSNGSISSASPSVKSTSSVSLASCCSDTERRGSVLSMASNSVRSFLPRSLARRNSVFPAGCIPQIKVTKSADPTPKKEKKRKMSKTHLEPPIWKYKEAKEEKKREKKKAEKEREEKEKSDKDKKKEKKEKKKKKK